MSFNIHGTHYSVVPASGWFLLERHNGETYRKPIIAWGIAFCQNDSDREAGESYGSFDTYPITSDGGYTVSDKPKHILDPSGTVTNNENVWRTVTEWEAYEDKKVVA